MVTRVGTAVYLVLLTVPKVIVDVVVTRAGVVVVVGLMVFSGDVTTIVLVIVLIEDWVDVTFKMGVEAAQRQSRIMGSSVRTGLTC